MAKQTSDDRDSGAAGPQPPSVRQDTAEESCDASYEKRPRAIIKPVAQKIGESDDNLRGRSDWYGHRTGLPKRAAD